MLHKIHGIAWRVNNHREVEELATIVSELTETLKEVVIATVIQRDDMVVQLRIIVKNLKNISSIHNLHKKHTTSIVSLCIGLHWPVLTCFLTSPRPIATIQQNTEYLQKVR